MTRHSTAISPMLVTIVCLAVLQLAPAPVAAGRGCVELDELTFDRVLQRYPDGALVKFDIAYPYGDKQEAYEKFAAGVAAAAEPQSDQSAHDLLVAEVGIKDYGDKDNAALAKRFGVGDKLPEVWLFVGGADGKRVRFPAAETFGVEQLKQFVRRNSRVQLGLGGCVPRLDAMARRLVQHLASGDGAEVQAVLAEARRWTAQTAEQETSGKTKQSVAGAIYVRLMELTVEKGLAFVPQETQRVQQLLQGKVSAAKRRELEQRVNVLRAFESGEDAADADDVNDEL